MEKCETDLGLRVIYLLFPKKKGVADAREAEPAADFVLTSLHGPPLILFRRK